MSGTLLFPLQPHPDESLHGLLWRVADENSYDEGRWLRAAIGIPARQKNDWKPEQAAQMAVLLGLPEDDIRQRAYLPTDAGRLFPGGRTSHDQIELNRPKICVACLRDRGYHSAVFDLAAVQICPRHATRLVSHCPKCNVPYRWGRKTPFHCLRCLTDDFDGQPQCVDPDQLPGTAALARRAGFGAVHPDIGEDQIAMPAALAHLALGEFITLLRRLGTYASGKPGRRRWQGLLIDDREKVHEIIQNGWDVLRDWPMRFNGFLETVASENNRSSGEPVMGLRSPFGGFYTYIANRNGEPWRTVRAAFEDYIRKTGLVLPRKGTVIDAGIDDGTSRYVSEIELSRRTGLGVARTAALVRSGAFGTVSVPQNTNAGKVQRIFFERSEIDRLFPVGTLPLDLKQTASRIGLSVTHTKQIMDEGAMKPVDGPAVSGNLRYLVSISTVEDFVSGLTPAACPVRGRPAGTVQLGKVMKIQRTLGLPLEDMLKAVRSGRLPVAAIDDGAIGIGSLRFDHRQVKTVLTEMAATERAPGAVTRGWIIKTLAVTKFTVAWLTKHGFLEKLPGKGNLKPFTQTSFENFTAEWAKAGELAATYKTSRMLITKALIATGVETTPRSDDSGIALFFSRSQIKPECVPAWLEEVALHRGKTWSEYDAGLKSRHA